MGLEESPHCPFDVMEACQTGVDKEWLKMEGQQEICGGGGGGDGGAAEEMDQDGSDVGGSSREASGAHGGTTTPDGWDQMTVSAPGWRWRRRWPGSAAKYWKRRRPSGKGQSGP